MPRITSLLLPALLALGACTGAGEIDARPEAEVKEVTEPPAPAEPSTPAPAASVLKGGLSADGSSSKVEWLGAKVTKAHPGGFKTFTVNAQVDGGAMTAVQAEIQLASIFSDSDRLTGHLKDEDFFHVAKYTTATFASTSVTPNAAEGATHNITGILDLHGVKKEITFPATVAVTEDGKATLEAEFSINRKDWGISYPGKAEDLIKDTVAISLDINLG